MNWKIFAKRCIYQDPRENIFVHQNILYRWLTFGNGPVQSLINRYRPERPALEYIKPLTLAVTQRPGDTCLFGLGGGCVAHALTTIPSPIHLDAVETNSQVIKIAQEYFQLKRIKKLTIIHQDAANFVQSSTMRYQHLLIDTYNEQQIPVQCNNLEFFKASQRRLLPDGFLAINIIGAKSLRPILAHLNQLFACRTLIIPVKHATNIVVLAYNGSEISPLLNLVRTAPSVKQLIWDSEWGYIAQLN